MKTIIISFLFLFRCLYMHAADTTHVYHIPDSIKAQIFLGTCRINSFPKNKAMQAGIKTDIAGLYFKNNKSNKQIVFEFPNTATTISTGINVTVEKGEMAFKYDWKVAKNYLLAITVAPDSAGNFLLCSGIVFFEKGNKSKLIGTCKIKGRWSLIAEPATFYKISKHENISVSYDNLWVLDKDNSWKSIKGDTLTPPSFKTFGNIDSIEQRALDISIIKNAIAKGKINTRNKTPESLYYEIIKQGTGRKITIDDSVIVYYHLMTINDTTTIDEAKTSTYTFALKSLIRAWQIGLPLCNVGCKIRLVAPSDLCYSTRTTISVLPPNSILIFDIEVIDAKKPN